MWKFGMFIKGGTFIPDSRVRINGYRVLRKSKKLYVFYNLLEQIEIFKRMKYIISCPQDL